MTKATSTTPRTIKYLLLLPLLAAPACASTSRASWHDGLSGMTTASHFPCGSVLLVWNARDRHARRWRVTVRDFGPFVSGRALDLSPWAFRRVFGSTRKGVCRIQFRLLKRGHCRTHRH